MSTRTTDTRHGFSLIEMVVVIGVITLILGFAISLGSNAVKSAQRVNTQERMVTIKQALENYVASNGYYPCPSNRALIPSNASFGEESRAGNGSCNATGSGVILVSQIFIGGVPVRSLGLPAVYAADSWGNKFTYAVGNNHVRSANSTANDDARITIRSGDRTGTSYILSTTTNRATVPSTPAAITAGSGATYALVSHGPDGRGAYAFEDASIAIACGSGTQTDVANCDDTDAIFYDSTYNDGDNEALFFDDFILWGSNALSRSPIQPAGPGTCTSGCQAWCAPCAGTLANLPLAAASFTSPKLCKKIITSTTPCNATCIWSGTVTSDSTVVRCP